MPPTNAPQQGVLDVQNHPVDQVDRWLVLVSIGQQPQPILAFSMRRLDHGTVAIGPIYTMGVDAVAENVEVGRWMGAFRDWLLFRPRL
jgi:hypothetical protein